MPQKIGVITTGGTIGSILSGDAMAVDPAGDIVRREISALCDAHGFEVTVQAAFNKNSEDLTPSDWGVLCGAVQSMLDDGISRIVITHGTDTLAHSATAVSLAFQDQDARICLTGSFHALEADNSDGPLNLLAAFQTVADDKIPCGVYVAFRRDSANDVAHIYAASDLKPMAFDGLAFDSVCGRRCATYAAGDGLTVTSGKGQMLRLPSVSAQDLNQDALAVAARQVLYVEHYPGLAFDRVDHTRLSVLLVGLYHSGTGHALSGQGSLLSFMEHIDPKPEVLAATFPSKAIDVPYESTATLIKSGVNVIKDLPVHVIYVFVVVHLACGRTAQDVVQLLQPWLMSQKDTSPPST